jgi:hypothetical protein
MEDLQRDIQREVDRLTARRYPKRRRAWTLLFVGAQGQVRRIERFAGLALLGAVFILAGALATVCLYLVYKRPMAENLQLSAELATARQENQALKGQKDLMLARLVVAESRGKKRPVPPTPDLTDALRTEMAPLPTVPPPGAAASGPDPLPLPRPLSARAPTPPAPAIAAAETTPAGNGTAGGQPARDASPRVVVEALAVSREAGTGAISIQFRIRNTGPQTEPISGRTFVILEPATGDNGDALTVPRVPLENGRPAVVKKGRYFSIARFNTVTFKTTDPVDLKRFRKATVLVYALSGELFMERSFSIEKNAS